MEMVSLGVAKDMIRGFIQDLIGVLGIKPGSGNFLVLIRLSWIKEDLIIGHCSFTLSNLKILTEETLNLIKRLLEVNGVRDNVANAWDFAGSYRNASVSFRLKACRRSLCGLKHTANISSRDRITQAQIALEREQSVLQPSIASIHYLKRELIRAQRDEEIFWWQKSKDKWLNGGDRNTSFFHNSVRSSRTRNFIVKLINAEGVEVFSEAAKGEVAVEFYHQLFRSSNPSPFDTWFHDMSPKVSSQMNLDPVKDVSALEVKEAVFSINPSKAPGPDGMSALFFQRFWDIIEEQFVKEVQLFFKHGILPREWNYTHLCLIPKIPNPQAVSDLRPISLCSVGYKTISKILVRRLQPWLKEIISPSQSAFVSERLMTDNITIAHEMVHSLGIDDDIASQQMVVKTDMSKAYDRVEWGYLRSLMCALGFDQRWIS